MRNPLRLEDEDILETSHLPATEAKDQKAVFAMRWFILPGLLCIISDMLVFARTIMNTMIGEMKHFNEIKPELATANIIEQTDYIMTMTLLIVMAIGVYYIFIGPLRFKPGAPKPAWIDHITAGNLKVKLTMSLATISAVGILPIFLNPSEFTNRDIVIKIVSHLVLMLTTWMTYQVTKDDIIPTHNNHETETHKHEVESH